MEAIIVTRASAKEIAALVLEIQGRRDAAKNLCKGQFVQVYKDGRLHLEQREC